MKNTSYIIWLAWLLFFPLQAKNKEHFYSYFSHITGSEGLSQNYVKSIIRDSYGFMWFGTKNGLNRYDGSSIRTIDCNDYVLGRGNHNISALYEDADRKLWVGTDEGIFIYDPVSEIFTFLNAATEDNLRITNWISDICSDSSGNIWIVAPAQGVFRYRDGKLFHYYITHRDHYNSQNPECICVRSNGEVWIGTNRAGLYLYDETGDSFTQYLTDKHGRTLKHENIFSICEYGNGLALAMHEGELKKYDIYRNELSTVNAPEVHYSVLRDVVCYDGELWVATQNGLFIINETENRVVHITEDPMKPYGLSDNGVNVIYRDSIGGTWIGTLFGGVNYTSDHTFFFEKYAPNGKYDLSSKRIRELAEDEAGQIWIGTEDAGINMLDTRTGTIQPIGKNTLSEYNCTNALGMLVNGNELWCGFFKRGLCTVNLTTGHIRHYSDKELGIDDASVYTLYKDRKGRIWIGSGLGVYVAPLGTRRFKKLDRLGYYWTVDILEDRDGLLWFASLGQGLCRYDPEKDRLTFFKNVPGDPTSLSSNSISSILEASNGDLWISTDRGGICRYKKETGKFVAYSIKDGLPDDVAYTILEDHNGNLWFGTNHGLVRFNPETRAIRTFTTNDGLLGNQFNYKSALKSKNGLFYFGGIEGLVSFNPLQTVESSPVPPLYITRMDIYNKEVTVHDKQSPLQKSILFTDKIVLPYDQSSISFEFAALDFSSPKAIQYAYRMENLDKDWIAGGNNHYTTYSKLPPGEYIFRVKAINNDTSWKETTTQIAIVILPPWWLSNWAYAGYILCAICLLTISLYSYKRHKDKQIKEKQALFEIEKEKELYSAKIEFFTEIAHEVRTPLTLINGPLETILEMDIQNPKLVSNLQVIAQNTNRLLELTRQLLDFRKVGANKFILDFVWVDIKKLLQDTIARFEPTFLQQHKEITIAAETENFQAAVDREAVIKILSNLLNNALKYSTRSVRITLEKNASSFTIKIASDGAKISPENSHRIFEPFFQIRNAKSSVSGAGIGLPLARSLAELHQGRLYLDPTENESFNTFILTLPLNQEKVIRLENLPTVQDEYIQDETSLPENQIKDCTILLVEDNSQIQTFISDKLKAEFKVETALDGVEALEILKKRPVDLIISDIMMPRMNGMELCAAVKSDIEISHTPFIFLTAKNDLDSKISGLKAGAEAYIEKPFSYNYLRTQIVTLLDNRRKEREAFAKRPFFPVHNMKMNKAEEEFVNKVIEIIQQNITDENFNVERLADILCMSRSNLLRKIKVLCNLSAVDFIKLVRLRKAAELIQEGRYRMGEICYMVGINSPSYFSKLFQKQFGVTPKDFARQNQMTEKETKP